LKHPYLRYSADLAGFKRLSSGRRHKAWVIKSQPFPGKIR
jgi:hypothetical protein